MEQFSSYVRQGFTAFDMADHYGDAEIIFICPPLRTLHLTRANRTGLVSLCKPLLILHVRGNRILRLPSYDSV